MNGKLNMQQNKIEPVIKKALGNRWEQLSDAIKRHYDICPGEDNTLNLHGEMSEVFHSNIAKLFLLPGRLFGALVPYRGRNIPTQVTNWTCKLNNNAMYWHRTLKFPGHPEVIFQSRMEHVTGNEIIEYVKYGMGIRLALFEENHALVYRGLGYVMRLGNLKLPIPNWLVLGEATIVEEAVSDHAVRLDFKMIHPVFGKTFGYSGYFAIEAG
jgi:hypothetical protein